MINTDGTIRSRVDKWFKELEAQVDEDEVARLTKAVADRHANDKSNLDRKILDDFHGHAPTIDESFDGQLPTLTPKAQILSLKIYQRSIL